MVVETLSIDAINAVSPYEVKIAPKGEALSFITDYDAEIFITFEKDDLLHKGVVYQFGISNPKRVRSPRDPKVRETVLAIVEEFFVKNKAAFLYVCETGDGLQRMRNRLFRFGLVYMKSERNTYSCLRRYMMRRVMIIMQL